MTSTHKPKAQRREEEEQEQNEAAAESGEDTGEPTAADQPAKPDAVSAGAAKSAGA
jgi:hypothetical protein